MKGRKLTDREVANLAPPETGDVEVFDAVRPGLHLRVYCTGGKVWLYRFRLGGKQRRLRLGRYPALSLAGAREAAKRAATALARGEDPGDRSAMPGPSPARTIAALGRLAGELGAVVSLPATDAPAGPSFGDLVARYGAERASRKASGAADLALLRKDALPVWRDRPIAELRRRDVAALLAVVAARAPVTANRLRSALSAVFAFGIDVELAEGNPARDARRPTVERPRSRVLSDAELRVLWGALAAEHPVVEAAFRLLLLLGQRSGEVRRLRWADLERDVWTIPGEFRKNRQPHAVPMPPAALAVVLRLRRLTGSSPWALESPRAGGRPLGPLAQSARRIGRRLGVVGWGPHDARRTCATRLAGLGFREVVPSILGHAARGVTRRVYDLHSDLDARRVALAAWERELLAIVGGE